MKERAFVRYTKSGRIVPGSLVITQGTYPKDGTYKEVTADQCCSPNELTFNVRTGITQNEDLGVFPHNNTFPYTGYIDIALGCAAMSNQTEWMYLYIPGTNIPGTVVNDIYDLARVLTEQAPYVGTFSVSEDGETLRLSINPEMAQVVCPTDLSKNLVFFVVPD